MLSIAGPILVLAARAMQHVPRPVGTVLWFQLQGRLHRAACEPQMLSHVSAGRRDLCLGRAVRDGGSIGYV